MDYQKIYEALRMIKEMCDHNNGVDCCRKCPLGKVNGTCCITEEIPENWNLTPPHPIIKLME